MIRAPQEIRTFFVTTVTANRRPLFKSEANAHLFLEILQHNRTAKKYDLHSFVLMPDHVHLLLTPTPDISLERAMQLIKGGFSFRHGGRLPVWQRGFNEHRIHNSGDHHHHAAYIVENPIRAKLCPHPAAYPFSSASLPSMCDPAPPHLCGSPANLVS